GEDVGCDAVIASKLAPTVFRGVHRYCVHHKSLRGSLFAIAVCQLVKMLDVMPSSRAGSLPQ
ncbi:hypothetical protein B1218_29710, partial [Pseudomonas ogarae]